MRPPIPPLRRALALPAMAFALSLMLALTEPLPATSSERPVGASGLGNEVIYSIMIDRFYSGRQSNDVPDFAFPGDSDYDRHNRYWLYKTFAWNLDEDRSRATIDTYWGGDLQGVIDKLDYLHWLGVTTILLSPVFENVNGYHYELGGTAYHGYWTKDFFRLEERFVNPPEGDQTLDDVLSEGVLLKELIDRAHGFDPPFKIILDIPLNHTSPAPIETTYLDEANYLEMGALFKDGAFVSAPCRLDGGKTCRDSAIGDGWFHPPAHWVEWSNPGTYYDGYLNGNLADLDQRQDKVRAYLDRAIDKWLGLGIDGLRLDAVKNIYPDYLQALETRLKRTHPDLILIGEYFDGGIFEDGIAPGGKPRSIEWLEGMPQSTMFDFSFARAVRAYFTGRMDTLGTPHFIRHILDPDSRNNPLGKRSNDLVTFINNQDIARMLSMEGATPERYKAALKLLFTAPGVPKLYYGDEIGLAYPTNHPHWRFHHRDDPHWTRLFMPWDRFEDPAARDYLTLARALIAMRKDRAFLRDGAIRFLSAWNVFDLFGGNSYLAIERFDADRPESGGVVYLYSARSRDRLEFETALADGDYDSLEGTATVRVRDGKLIWRDIAANEAIVVTYPAGGTHAATR